MADICIFNSAYRESQKRWISVDDVNVVTMKMDYLNRPYMLFEHKDYPLGALCATFQDGNWYCDLD
jgi:hypothetical protein